MCRYETAEETATRYGIFKENRVYIKKMNEESEGVTFDINQFADLTHDEFAEKCPGGLFRAFALPIRASAPQNECRRQ